MFSFVLFLAVIFDFTCSTPWRQAVNENGNYSHFIPQIILFFYVDIALWLLCLSYLPRLLVTRGHFWYRFYLTFRVSTRLGKKKVRCAFGSFRFTLDSFSNEEASAKWCRRVTVTSIPLLATAKSRILHKGETVVLVLILFLDQLSEKLATRSMKNMNFGDQNFVTFTFINRWPHVLNLFVYAGVVASGIVNALSCKHQSVFGKCSRWFPRICWARSCPEVVV